MIRSPRRHRRLASTFVAPLLVFSLALGGVACSSDEDDASSAVLDQVAPTKADIAEQADIAFPKSTEGFRLVRIGPDQIDVTFTVDAADVDEFATGSKLTLTDGERVIAHASPLWDVAVLGAMQGGESVRNTVKRSVEVIPDGDTAIVRLTLLNT